MSEQRDPTRAPDVRHTHRDVTGGWLRPALFGVTDGLGSNFSLIAGVAGASLSPHQVLLTGLAGLVAGAFSMSSGEYVSVTSQTELAHAEIAVERREIKASPDAEKRELAMIYEAKGLDRELAGRVADELSTRDDVWREHAREELGIDPDDLPSGWTAAASSFVAFGVGAAVPLMPYLLGGHTLLWPMVLSVLALFASGAFSARFTSRQWWYAGGRQVLIGVLAAAVTYGVGHLVGARLT